MAELELLREVVKYARRVPQAHIAGELQTAIDAYDAFKGVPYIGKIYLFCHYQGFVGIRGDRYVDGFAMAEDGTLLTRHVSSSEGWSRKDLQEEWHQTNEYAKHYPEGFILEFVTIADFATHAGLQEAIVLNKAAKARDEQTARLLQIKEETNGLQLS